MTRQITGTAAGLDDALADAVKNGRPALAQPVAALANELNRRSYAGRPIAAWWANHDERDYWRNGLAVQRSQYANTHDAVRGLRAAVLYLPCSYAQVAGQGARLRRAGANYDTPIPYDHHNAAAVMPAELQRTLVGAGCDIAPTGTTSEVTLGSASVSGGNNDPSLMAGMLYEPAQGTIDDSTPNQSTLVAPPSSGDDIIGPGPGIAGLDRLRDRFLHTWGKKRPHLSWAFPDTRIGCSPVPYVSMSSTMFRYLFDLSVGDGGIAPSKAGPAITLPTRYAAAHGQTTVKVALYVYACMADIGATGRIGVSRRDSSIDSYMTPIAEITGAPVVTGTSWAWYSGTFLANASTTNGYDRVLVCGKTSSGTVPLRVAAMTMIITPD